MGRLVAGLARDTLWMLAWQGLRAALLAAWAIGLGRLLGPAPYGLLAGTAGLATALGAMVGFGFGLLMLQATSRVRTDFGRTWSNAIAAILLSATALLGLFLALGPLILERPMPLWSLVAIALPELLLLPLTIACSHAFQAHGRMGWAGAMYTLVPAGNVAALTGFAATSRAPDLHSYLHWHLLGAAVTGALAMIAVQTLLRPRWLVPQVTRTDAGEAAGFTMMRVVDTALGSLDKTLVLRLAGEQVAGHYTAAYRLASLVALPMVSLAISSTSRLFGSPQRESSSLPSRMLRWGLLLGLTSLPVTWGLAYVLPWLFGDDFLKAASLAQLMTPLPALLGLSSLGCTVLMASGLKRHRITLQACALLLLLGFMAVLAPPLAGEGAVLALLLTHAALVLALWRTIIAHRFGGDRP